jgi:hypothetical protein
MSSHPSPKWFALVDDRAVPMPRDTVSAHLLRTQADIAPDRVLRRDLNSPHDPVIEGDTQVDLIHGNVFYTQAEPARHGSAAGDAPPKLALLVNDRWEVTLLSSLKAADIVELFGLPAATELVRDYESPNDQAIPADSLVHFREGPVFIARAAAGGLTIVVNKKLFTSADGVKPNMSGREIAALVTKHPEETEVTKLVGGQPQKIALDQTVCITNGDEFEVIRRNVKGGFEPTRIDREVRRLRAGGATVTHVPEPAAVVYHGLRTKPGHPVPESDVLVIIPGGYPAAALDGAYLPEGSPLLGRVPGSAQVTIVTALGRRWQLVSYHPHNGGGGPPWDKDLHGFHTYYDYLLAWLRN